jgi:hypothetical protein
LDGAIIFDVIDHEIDHFYGHLPCTTVFAWTEVIGSLRKYWKTAWQLSLER